MTIKKQPVEEKPASLFTCTAVAVKGNRFVASFETLAGDEMAVLTAKSASTYAVGASYRIEATLSV